MVDSSVDWVKSMGTVWSVYVYAHTKGRNHGQEGLQIFSAMGLKSRSELTTNKKEFPEYRLSQSFK